MTSLKFQPGVVIVKKSDAFLSHVGIGVTYQVARIKRKMIYGWWIGFLKHALTSSILKNKVVEKIF